MLHNISTDMMSWNGNAYYIIDIVADLSSALL